jgi:hypothetical protein
VPSRTSDHKTKQKATTLRSNHSPLLSKLEPYAGLACSHDSQVVVLYFLGMRGNSRGMISTTKFYPEAALIPICQHYMTFIVIKNACVGGVGFFNYLSFLENWLRAQTLKINHAIFWLRELQASYCMCLSLSFLIYTMG